MIFGPFGSWSCSCSIENGSYLGGRHVPVSGGRPILWRTARVAGRGAPLLALSA